MTPFASNGICWANCRCRRRRCMAFTRRARWRIFRSPRRPVHPELARAYGTVKLACARTNRALGAWADDAAKADAIERACRELSEGQLARAHRRGCVAGRRRHQHQHECQRGAGQPRAGNCSAATHGDLRPRLAAGRFESAPVHERHLSDGAAAGGHPRASQVWSRNVVALQESFQASEKKFAARRQGRPHPIAGRRADDAGPRNERLRRGHQPRPLAHLQMRGAAARGESGRHRHRHRAWPRRGSSSSRWWTSCAN